MKKQVEIQVYQSQILTKICEYSHNVGQVSVTTTLTRLKKSLAEYFQFPPDF